jgi:proteasome assembly chaperone (PAC2) family protein
MFENKFNEEIRLTTSLLSKVKTDNSALEQKIETFKTAIQKLQETEKSLNKQLEKCAEEKENVRVFVKIFDKFFFFFLICRC